MATKTMEKNIWENKSAAEYEGLMIAQGKIKKPMLIKVCAPDQKGVMVFSGKYVQGYYWGDANEDENTN